MRGAEVRAAARARPRELLGDRPWGVGILGFVPPEVREEQLAVVRDIRPPVALIAGGRPSQARAARGGGHRHVPARALAGPARSVPEGRRAPLRVRGPRVRRPRRARAPASRCGRAQIERLLARRRRRRSSQRAVRRRHPRRALGRDGRGDGRAARRARRPHRRADGHRLPVHRGGRGERARSSRRSRRWPSGASSTVLLETSPGHATRCADTDYVRAFAEREAPARAREGADGKDDVGRRSSSSTSAGCASPARACAATATALVARRRGRRSAARACS